MRTAKRKRYERVEAAGEADGLASHEERSHICRSITTIGAARIMALRGRDTAA